MLEIISGYIWGIPTILILILIGAYFTLGTRFLQLRRFWDLFRLTVGSLFRRKGTGEGISPFRAMATALAGTIGTGNIVGVATALAAGGPGAIFWMWVSAFFGMMTKFAEVALAVKFREKAPEGGYRGGPMYTILHGMGRRFRPLAMIFALLCMLASFGIGNLTQVHSAASSLQSAFGILPLAAGIVFAALLLITVFGGTRRITDLAGFLVPFMSAFYMIGAVLVIGVNYQRILPTLFSIFSGAFSYTSVLGGAAGYTAAAAMRFGVARGIFTNEAGLGSAPIAHAAAENTPFRQGLWGAFEVFFDTIVVCTLTALVILTSGAFQGPNMSGAELTTAGFAGILGKFAPGFIAVSLTLFAFACLICWCFYGEQCCRFLFGDRSRLPVTVYRILFAGAALFGTVLRLELVWNLSDILNGLMILPNSICLLALSNHVFGAERAERG